MDIVATTVYGATANALPLDWGTFALRSSAARASVIIFRIPGAARFADNEPEGKKDLLRSAIGMADSLLHGAHGCPAYWPAGHADGG